MWMAMKSTVIIKRFMDKRTLKDSFANSCNTSFSKYRSVVGYFRISGICVRICCLIRSCRARFGWQQEQLYTVNRMRTKARLCRLRSVRVIRWCLRFIWCLWQELSPINGVAMEPYVVDHVENDGGVPVKNYKGKEYGELLSASDAALLQDYMRGVVENGTGKTLNGQSYTAYGKTGSAEYNSAGDSHGWFVGYGSKRRVQRHCDCSGCRRWRFRKPVSRACDKTDF